MSVIQKSWKNVETFLDIHLHQQKHLCSLCTRHVNNSALFRAASLGLPADAHEGYVPHGIAQLEAMDCEFRARLAVSLDDLINSGKMVVETVRKTIGLFEKDAMLNGKLLSEFSPCSMLVQMTAQYQERTELATRIAERILQGGAFHERQMALALLAILKHQPATHERLSLELRSFFDNAA